MRRDGITAVPPITAAKAITITPIPIDTSAAPSICANRPPASPVNPFAIASPTQAMRSTLIPFAFTMRGFAPVARSARPKPVARNRSSSTFATITTMPTTMRGTYSDGMPSRSPNE